jgi:outer membrane biosynthesis protein TonB
MATLHFAAPRLHARRRCGGCAQPAVCAAKPPKAKPSKPAPPAKPAKAAKPLKPQPEAAKKPAAKPRGEAAAPRSPPPAPPVQPPAPPAATVAHPAADALAALPALPAGPPLSAEQLLSFERDGHVALRGLLTAAEVAALAPGLHAALDARRVDAVRTGVRVALGEAALVDDFGLPFD